MFYGSQLKEMRLCALFSTSCVMDYGKITANVFGMPVGVMQKRTKLDFIHFRSLNTKPLCTFSAEGISV
jgi:hypothetical protein